MIMVLSLCALSMMAAAIGLGRVWSVLIEKTIGRNPS